MLIGCLRANRTRLTAGFSDQMYPNLRGTSRSGGRGGVILRIGKLIDRGWHPWRIGRNSQDRPFVVSNLSGSPAFGKRPMGIRITRGRFLSNITIANVPGILRQSERASEAIATCCTNLPLLASWYEEISWVWPVHACKRSGCCISFGCCFACWSSGNLPMPCSIWRSKMKLLLTSS